MKNLLLGLIIFAILVTPKTTFASNENPQTRDEFLLNSFEVMCAIERSNDFTQLDTKAKLMHMQLVKSSDEPSPQGWPLHVRLWAGNLKSGPFVLHIEEMTTPKSILTICGVDGPVPDADKYREEVIKTLKLSKEPDPVPGPNPKARAFVWKPKSEFGTTVIIQDMPSNKAYGVEVEYAEQKKREK